MQKPSEGQVFIGGVFVLAIWLFVGLPWLYAPQDQRQYRSEPAQALTQSVTPAGSVILQHLHSAKDEQKTDGEKPNMLSTLYHWFGTFFEVKLTDVLIVFFTAVLAIKTSGLFTETAGLRSAADQQAVDMKNSIKSAADAARAAVTGNQIAITNSEQQLRAYVTASDVKFIVNRDSGSMGAYGPVDGPIQSYGLAVVFRNGGQTPAINVRTNSSKHYFDSAVPDDFQFPDSERFGSGLIGPDSETHEPIGGITANQMNPNLCPGTWLIWGWVEYDDIFTGSPRHRTEYCFAIDRVWRLNGQLWVGAHAYTKFNAMDLGCARPSDPAKNKKT